MKISTRKAYLTDLTDEQWTILEPLVPASKHGGRPREVDMREVANTILYLTRTGCQWNMLPHDLQIRCTEPAGYRTQFYVPRTQMRRSTTNPPLMVGYTCICSRYLLG